jgi:predicted GNAT family N-acyltransferase
VFKIATTQEELIKVFIVRAIVFMDEQKVPYAIEMDEHEDSATHILGEIDNEPVAAGRLRFLGEWAKLERIAVRKEYRKRGYGHEIVEYMLAVARDRGFHKFRMHAQAYLSDYYAQHGFTIQGDLFQEAGINHYLMIRTDPQP